MGLGLLIIICGLTLAAVIIFGAIAFERFRSEIAHANIIGKEARVVDWSGEKGHVHARNRVWPAYATDPVNLHPGSKVLISKIDNGALKISPIEEDIEVMEAV
ncbi:MAG: hypothetical protein KJ667_04215 [Alphaproteobacteria bacterium]|nr:hypothetical protein [Alphaproteobacteria bacterium]